MQGYLYILDALLIEQYNTSYANIFILNGILIIAVVYCSNALHVDIYVIKREIVHVDGSRGILRGYLVPRPFRQHDGK